MKDIILPITCYQIKLGLFITLGATAISSLIIGILNDNAGLFLYGLLGSTIFFSLCCVFFMIACEEGRLPRFPIRCKCDED